MGKKVLFVINSLGLGHATRCIPFIHAVLKRNHTVHILSSGRAMKFLKEEFGDKITHFHVLNEYRYLQRLFIKECFNVKSMITLIPLFLYDFYKENIIFKKINKKEKFDNIISDTRYGVFGKRKNSYLLAHHIFNTIEGYEIVSRLLSECLYIVSLGFFSKLLILDWNRRPIGGDYTHGFKYMGKNDYRYIGTSSMIHKKDIEKDIDYFFSISGPEPMRTHFEKKVLSSLLKLKEKKIVVTLGKPEKKEIIIEGKHEIYGYLHRKKQEEIMNRAKLVITRSGYSTIMDLAEINAKALLIPTKGQPEQEYLAKYHNSIKTFMKRDIDDLIIPDDLIKAEKFNGLLLKHSTSTTVRRFLKETNL
jgi:UDP:flavonoid glycosyltransferase YjiC (YdhE family)